MKWQKLPAITNRCQISWKPKTPGTGLEKMSITNGIRDNNLRIGNPQNALGFDVSAAYFIGHTNNIDSLKEAVTFWEGYTNEQYAGIKNIPVSFGTYHSPTINTNGKGWSGSSFSLGPSLIIGRGQSRTYKIWRFRDYDK